jgi:uncharacterized protein
MKPEAFNEDPRLVRLASVVQSYGPTLVAFSGGVDSTLVAYVAKMVHGDASLAVTGVSPSLAQRERDDSSALAQSLGLRHEFVETHEGQRPGYQANLGDRCYHCKSELFTCLAKLAASKGFAAIATGDNLDDLGDVRPGLRAADEYAVKKPLIEAGLGKTAIRELAAQLGLPNHDKPAAPCLASRIAVGERAEPKTLARIEAAEAVLQQLGFRICRVRHHAGELARIEVPLNEVPRAVELRQQIEPALRALGYRHVTVDLGGFRSGSLNILPS